MSFQKVAAFFRRDEFACQCGCGFDTIDHSTLSILKGIRRHFGPVVITSGCRCPDHNESIGGSPNSQHKLGRAADFYTTRASLREVSEWLKAHYPESSVGIYDNFLHLDTRSDGPCYWDMRSVDD
jgi:uncharacterized protein YcbK (DUF882 family)